jgi:methyl-accepting chemotaxis protein
VKHGKGFAVVAEEVKNLAQRSATAAKEKIVLLRQITEPSLQVSVENLWRTLLRMLRR